MVDKFLYIPNDDLQNYQFYRLKLLFEKFEYLKKVHKVFEPTNKIL